MGDVRRGIRCPKCYWALYDGTWCQNPECEDSGKDILEPIRLSTWEAEVLIHAKAVKNMDIDKKQMETEISKIVSENWWDLIG